jgi:thiamine monophosphate synthase
VAACLAAGAAGVSAIFAIWNAEDPVAALGEFREALGGL